TRQTNLSIYFIRFHHISWTIQISIALSTRYLFRLLAVSKPTICGLCQIISGEQTIFCWIKK
ncbi:unnamed protein product, partial [Callosobruchus maculatus]